MEDYLRYGLLILAALIIGFILIESWWRHRRFKLAEIAARESSESFTDEFFEREPTLLLPQEHSLESAPEEEKTAEANTRMDTIETSSANVSSSTTSASNYLAISVFAKNQMHFESYDLLQAISATGMQFGEMNIFHYYLPTDHGKKILFSLASATKPGCFDLDKIGEFACNGLTLFMQLNPSLHQMMGFNKMLEVAEQLADNLDGELRSDPYTPWSSATLTEYKKKIQQCSV